MKSRKRRRKREKTGLREEKKIQSAQPTEKCPLGDESPFTTNVVVAVVVVVVV